MSEEKLTESEELALRMFSERIKKPEGFESGGFEPKDESPTCPSCHSPINFPGEHCQKCGK
jgi:hypothetical protein